MRGPSIGPMSVSSVDDAMTWLFRHTRPEEWLYAPDADLPQVVLFACDMFWLSPSVFVAKMRRKWETAMGCSEPVAARRRRLHLGRR